MPSADLRMALLPLGNAHDIPKGSKQCHVHRDTCLAALNCLLGRAGKTPRENLQMRAALKEREISMQ